MRNDQKHACGRAFLFMLTLRPKHRPNGEGLGTNEEAAAPVNPRDFHQKNNRYAGAEEQNVEMY